jgi:hypothetical protein
MKIALILTGFTRTYKHSFPLLQKNILDRYDVDLYLATWNKRDDGTYIDINYEKLYSGYNLKESVVKNIDFYNAEKFVIKKLTRENDVFDYNQRAKIHGEYWANRLKDQWFLVKTAFQSINNINSYDLILRLRFDLFLESILLFNAKGVVIPADIGGWSFTDHMAYGDVESMSKYCLLHDSIYSLYVDNNIDITHAVDMPKFYLESYGNPVKITTDKNIRYSIRK